MRRLASSLHRSSLCETNLRTGLRTVTSVSEEIIRQLRQSKANPVYLEGRFQEGSRTRCSPRWSPETDNTNLGSKYQKYEPFQLHVVLDIKHVMTFLTLKPNKRFQNLSEV